VAMRTISTTCAGGMPTSLMQCPWLRLDNRSLASTLMTAYRCRDQRTISLYQRVASMTAIRGYRSDSAIMPLFAASVCDNRTILTRRQRMHTVHFITDLPTGACGSNLGPRRIQYVDGQVHLISNSLARCLNDD